MFPEEIQVLLSSVVSGTIGLTRVRIRVVGTIQIRNRTQFCFNTDFSLSSKAQHAKKLQFLTGARL
jgi:hypothetical protein